VGTHGVKDTEIPRGEAMRGRTRWLWAVVLGLGGLLIGCGGDPKTPVVQMHRALEKGDKELFMQSVYAENLRLAYARFECDAARASFYRALRKAYGTKTKSGQTLKTWTAGDLAAGAKVEKGHSETEAIVKLRNGEDVAVVKTPWGWKVDLTRMFRGADQLTTCRYHEYQARQFREVEKKVGSEGYDADKLLHEFLTEMLKAVKEHGWDLSLTYR